MINPDPVFWDGVASHPQVSPHVFMDREPESLAPLLEMQGVIPMASENGGILFMTRDPLGMVYEMHTMYKPEGWGREVAKAAKTFMHEMFKTASVLVTQEQEGNWRSCPPKSHGWQIAGDYCNVGLSKRLRMWVLTKQAWMASPVGRKMQCQ